MKEKKNVRVGKRGGGGASGEFQANRSSFFSSIDELKEITESL